MQNIATRTIREIAVESPATTRVFEKYKIDYCCRGNTPFNEACRAAGVSPDIVSQKIRAILASAADNQPGPHDDLNLDQLIEHIMDKHHVYTKQELEQLTPLMEKVARKQGEHHPQLLELKGLFQDVCDDLSPHMMKEEMVLFPYISRLEADASNHSPTALPPFVTVQNPVRMMSMEHERIGSLLAQMRVVTKEYALPAGACPSFSALYHRLAALESDLHQHIHLENNLLFPLAVELEKNR